MIAAWVVGAIVAYVVGCGVTAACVEGCDSRDEEMNVAVVALWPGVVAMLIPIAIVLVDEAREALEDRAQQKRLPEARVVK